MIEIFETYSGQVGVRYQLGFNDAGLEVFDDPDAAFKFVASLGVDLEEYYYEDEELDG